MSNPTIPAARKGVPKLSDALAPLDAGAEPHVMRDPFDIGEALEALAASGEPVSVYPFGALQNVRMARIHCVDPEHPSFVIDFAADLPPPGAATLVAALGANAKLQFELAQDWHGQSGQPNLVPAQFPASCLVLNRRAAQRQETPVGGNYVATFNLPGKSYELPLYDLSVGGVGLRASPDQAFGLHVGRKLNEVRLDLGPALALTVDLEIRLLRPFKTFLLGEQVQIGCSFVNVPMQVQQQLERLVSAANARRRAG